MKRAAIILLSIGALFAGLLLLSPLMYRPPKEASLLQNFYAHRTSFERLRDMLRADETIRRLADWGVDTGRFIHSKPPEGIFPIDRYEQYLALIKDVHALAVSRDGGPHPEFNIHLWGYGFGGDTHHIGICWRDDPPSRAVSSFDAYFQTRRSSQRRDWTFQHIDSNWYLFTDM